LGPALVTDPRETVSGALLIPGLRKVPPSGSRPVVPSSSRPARSAEFSPVIARGKGKPTRLNRGSTDRKTPTVAGSRLSVII